jgi:hypothetical protein
MHVAVGEVTLEWLGVELMEQSPLSDAVFLYSQCLRRLIMFGQVTRTVAVTRDRGQPSKDGDRAGLLAAQLQGCERLNDHRTQRAGVFGHSLANARDDELGDGAPA